MNDMFREMIRMHDTKDPMMRDQVIREVVQELIIYGLSQAGFFNKAAFVGGTSLRIFHGLDRFSEDLDFMLMGPIDFDIKDYFPILKDRLSAFGITFEATEKKREGSKIAAGEVKALSKELYLAMFEEDEYSNNYYKTQLTRIKIEVDTDPAGKATFERKIRTRPFIHQVTICDKQSLFAGKIHAVLFRSWGRRVKGRDLYDFLFYAIKDIPFNIDFLNEKIKKSGKSDRDLTFEEIIDSLKKRFMEIDYKSAIDDVLNFIDPMKEEELKYWGPELFIQVTEDLKCEGTFTFPGDSLEHDNLAHITRGRKKGKTGTHAPDKI